MLSPQYLSLEWVWVVVTAMLLVATWWFLMFLPKPYSSKQHQLPIMAPTSMMQTIQHVSGDDMPWFLLRTARALGTNVFRLNLPALSAVAIGDATLLRQVLTDPTTIKPPVTYGPFKYVTNRQPSIFSTNGSFWQLRRKGTVPAFHATQVQRMNAVALEQTNAWIRRRLTTTTTDSNNGVTLDVGKEMIDLLISSITETAFEYTFNEEERTVFVDNLTLCFKEFLFKSTLNPLRPLLGRLLPERRRAHVAAERVHELSLRIIAAYRARQQEQEQQATPGTLIDFIMNNPAYENDDQRAVDCTVFLIGGHDTTAYTIAWALKELAQHPELQRQLREELRSSGEGDYNQSTLLRMTIREILRLHPVAAVYARQLGGDYTISDGMFLQKGMVVFCCNIILLRDPSVFVNPDVFDPFRWERPTEEMNRAFLPFSLGKQNCVGQALANSELHTILPRLLSEFEFSVEDEGTVEYFLTLKSANTLLRVTKAP